MNKKRQLLLAATLSLFAMAINPVSAQTDDSSWAEVWRDDFTGTALNTSYWNIEQNSSGGGNNELQYYGPEGVSVSNGNLVLTASRTANGGKSFTSGRINSKHKVFFTHGKLEASIKLPKTANGLWPAFWMLGENIDTNPWPQCGEVDVLEMGNVTGINNGTQESFFNGACHWGYYENGGYPNYGVSQANYGSLQDGNYHTFTLIWSETAITMYVDRDKGGIYETPYYTIGITDKSTDKSTGYYFHKNFHILFNLAVGGMFPQIYDPAGITAITNDRPAEMLVDWVRICQPADNEEYTFLVEDEDESSSDKIGNDPDTDIGQFGSLAVDDNGNYTFDKTKGTDYVLISTSTGVTEMLSDRTLKNYNVDNVQNFLYIWDNTYNAAASTGVNSFGFAEGYNSFTVGTVGWSGLGFASVKGSGKDLSMIDDSYILHFAMKGNDIDLHRSHTVTVGNANFIIGYSDGTNPSLGDYKRDNRWYYFDIPVKWIKTLTPSGELFTGAANYAGNVLAFNSGSFGGTPLKFDNVFFYKATTAIPDIPTTDTQTSLGAYGSEALNNGTTTFDFTNGYNYVPIIVSPEVKNRMTGKILADYNVDGTNQALYIWENTYTEVSSAGETNSFGFNEGYNSLIVANKGWSGLGVKFETPRDMSIVDDTFWLHFAMKGDDYIKHVGQTIAIGNTQFIIGKKTSSLPSLGDYKRDGNWYAFDIPVKALMLMADPLFTNAAAFKDNLITIKSGGKAGNQLQFDNVFFYKNDTKDPNAGSDTETVLGKYVSEAMSAGTSTFNFNDGDNYVIIDVSDQVKAQMNGKILKDYNGVPALNVWRTDYENPPQPTFEETTSSGNNSFGYNEAYHSFRLGSKGWGNVAYQFTGAAADLSMLEDVDANGHEYYLHFAMKSSDYLTHVNYTIKVGDDATFNIGTGGDASFKTDFRRDGEWYSFDIPVSKLKELATSGHLLSSGTANAYSGDLLNFDAGTRNGNELIFDNVFFYRNLNPATEEENEDETAPSVPTVTLNGTTTQTTASINLSATDDSEGQITYAIYINNVKAGTVKGNSGATATYNLTGLTAATTYSITATATDAAGNTSAASTALNITTQEATPEPTDETAPSVPTVTLSGTATQTSATVQLTSTDNSEGTITYTIYVNGAEVGTTTGNSGATATYNITGLTAGTTYAVTATAADAVGNTSARSTALNVTTEEEEVVVPEVNSGETSHGLKYTYEITQNGTDVTINFTCTNPTDFVGLVGPWLWDETTGFREVGYMPQTLTGYDYGTTLKFRAKWIEQNNGDNISEYVYYTIKPPYIAESGDLHDEGADANGIHKLTGTWTDTDFKNIDSQVKGNAYDVTGVTIASGDFALANNELQNPNTFFVATQEQTTQMTTVNAVYKDNGSYVGNSSGLTFTDSNGSKTKDYSLNTSLAPIYSSASYVSRNITAGAWATQVLPFPTTITENKPEAYTLNAQNEDNGTLTLTFQKVEESAGTLSLEANVPYLLWFDTKPEEYTLTSGGNVTMTLTPQTSSTTDFALAGTYQTINTTAEDNIYVIPGGQTDKENFSIRLSVGGRVLPFRSYFAANGVTPAKINILISDEPINGTTPDDGEQDGTNGIRTMSDDMIKKLLPVYSIDGKKVADRSTEANLLNLPDGVYIINGKKIVIRNK